MSVVRWEPRWIERRVVWWNGGSSGAVVVQVEAAAAHRVVAVARPAEVVDHQADAVDHRQVEAQVEAQVEWAEAPVVLQVVAPVDHAAARVARAAEWVEAPVRRAAAELVDRAPAAATRADARIPAVRRDSVMKRLIKRETPETLELKAAAAEAAKAAVV